MKNMLWLMLLVASAATAKEFDRKNFDSSVEAIKKNAKVELSDEEIYKAAVDGVLRHLETKHRAEATPSLERSNTLLEPRTAVELKNDLEGNVTGIGIVLEYDPIEKKQRYPLVTKVLPQGGAQATRIQADDEILAIDGKPTREFAAFRDMVYALRGEAGSKVSLSLLRGAKIIEAKVERKVIPYEPVTLEGEDLAFPTLVVNYFNKKTEDLLAAKLATLKQAKGLVIDMRQCGGGGLSEGIESLKLFTPKDKLMLQMASRKETRQYRAESAGAFTKLPLAVLVSGDTRSMCEAFAYSLRANRGALILGEATHGKATVETLYEVGDGYSAKFTIGQLLGPDGKTWQQDGVVPDIAVDLAHAEDAARTYLAR